MPFSYSNNNLSNNYDKNNSDATVIADCNASGQKIGSLTSSSKNSPNSEGLTSATEGLIFTAFPKRFSWNCQLALPNGVSARPCVRGVSTGSWGKWRDVALKDDLLISASGTGPTDWTALETTGNMPFKIWNVTKASTSKGAPSGCYDYGTLIALVATATGDRWRNTLIYLPDNNNNVGNKVYVRSGISTKWLAISGTDVDSVS